MQNEVSFAEVTPIKSESRTQRIMTLIGSTLGYGLDSFDNFLLSAVLFFVIADFHISPAQAGNLTFVTTMGTLAGAYLFGFLADIFGRIRMLILTILLYSVGTGVLYFVTGYGEFAFVRFLIGMGIGGEFGIGMAVVTEVFAPKMRGKATSTVAVGAMLGILAGSLLAAAVVPALGWRSVFIFGLLPAFLAVFVRVKMKEPEMWKSRNDRKKELLSKSVAGNLDSEEQSELNKLKGFPLSKLFANRKITITTIGLIIMSFVQNFGFYSIFSWMPTVLATKYHYTLAKASGWLTISTFGMIIGIILFGILMDRIGRKKTFAIYYIGGTLWCMIYFFLIKDPNWLLWGSAMLGFFVNGMVGGFGTILSENYPSEARSTAGNFIFGTGRGFAGFGPALIGLLTVNGNVMGALAIVFLIYPIGLIAMMTMVPETKDIEME